jgi:hypothetical protein
MSETKIAEHWFLYNGVKYFRDAAENIDIAAYGDKRDAFGPKASLNVHNQVARENLKGRVRDVTVADVNWESQSKGEVEINVGLKYFTASGSGTAGFSYEKAKSARLKLAKFVIDEGDLRAMLNNDAGAARNYLAKEGQDARIVSTVWVVLEGELAQTFSAAAKSTGSITASLTKAAELQITAKHSGSTQQSSTIVLKRGVTFAYAMHKVKKWNKDKTRIEDLALDVHS